MTDNEGIPTPPIRRSAPAQASRADVPPGLVKDSLDVTRLLSAETTSRWAGALSDLQTNPRPTPFRPFQAGENPLQPVTSLVEQTSDNDTSLSGVAKNIFKSAFTGFSHPIASVTDQAEVTKIRTLQGDFLRNHDSTIRNLDQYLADAKDEMKQMSNVLGQNHFDTSPIDQIMAQKKQLGDSLMGQIDDALGSETDPDELERLRSLKSDLSAWQQDRDARIQQEQPDVDQLTAHMKQIDNLSSQQGSVMQDAAMSRGPGYDTGSDAPGQPSHVIATGHAEIGAIRYVMGLEDFLLGSKAQVDQALGGGG